MVKEEILALFKKIQDFDKISIFFHQLPDLDALGSAFGLKTILKLNFANKDVKVIGFKDVINDQKINTFLEIEPDDHDDLWIKESLGIIVDTANDARVFSQLHHLCKDVVRFDHHPLTEKLGSVEWVDDQYSSTCEMVVDFAKSLDLKVNEQALNYLYFGLLTDTNRFMYPSVSARTYELVAWMLNHGLNRSLVHNDLYLRSLEDAKKDALLFDMIHVNEYGVASLFLDQSQNKRFNQKTFSDKVSLMAGYKEIKIWTILYYDEINNQWKGSIRSRDYIVNDVAQTFNGGGHKLAAGFKLENPDQFKLVIEALNQKVINNETIKFEC